MKFQPELLENQFVVQQYDKNSVVISGKLQTESVIFGTHFAPLPWKHTETGCLSLENCQWLIEQYPPSTEVILIGTGAQQIFPDRNIQKIFTDKRCPVEFMNSQAACRTYNILVAERRLVIAAILL